MTGCRLTSAFATTSVSGMSALTSLDFSSNLITGSVQATVSGLTALRCVLCDIVWCVWCVVCVARDGHKPPPWFVRAAGGVVCGRVGSVRVGDA
jgi:hypothetical protein